MATNKTNDSLAPTSPLRVRAEELLRAKPSDMPTMPTADMQALVHELNVHQMELEIQNEELRQAQLALAHSHDRYSDLYDFAPVGYVTLDKDGKILEANLTAAVLLGGKRSDLVGANLSAWIARDSQDDFYRHRQAVFSVGSDVPGSHVADPRSEARFAANGISYHAKQICDLQMRAPDGTPLVVRLESIAFTDNHEQQCHTALIDVTQWNRAEVALLQLNQTLEQRVARQTHEVKLLAKAMAKLGEGMMITTGELGWPGPQIVYVNEAMCRISGYTAEELIGQTPRIFHGDKTDRATVQRLRRELSEGSSHLCELINHRKDDTPYDAELFITPLFNADGEPTNFIAIHRDISERKRAERLFLDREARLRAILDTAADAVITIDRRGIIDGVNSATESMFGYTQAELIGHEIKILMPAPYCDEHDSYISRYLETGEARMIGIGRDVSGRRKDGSTFPISLAVSEVRHLGLFTGIIRDISDRRNLQKQILEIAAEEDRRIGHELHDNIQQQLTGLGLLAQSLADALANETSQQAGLAARLAKGISESANDVHLLSRGLVPVEVDAEGLRAALTDLASRVRQQYGVRCDFQSAGSVAITDRFVATHLYRIAQEGVNNAIKHGEAKHIRLSLTCADGSITLEVLDDGIGIVLPRPSGPGMGLQIMEYRASLIGGTMQVAPKEDGGTVITCTTSQGGGNCDA